MSHRLVRLAPGALALAALLSTPAARAGDTEPGVYWEQTVEMQMQGMNMPAMTQKVCVPKRGLDEPPKPGPGQDESCEITDVKKVGPKMTWKMKCTGREAMTGEGEIVQGKDRYTGKMDMHMAQGDMTMKMSGKLLGGDCDAGKLRKEIRKQVADAEKQQQQAVEDGEVAMAKLCDEAIEEADLRMFSGPVVTCKKPDQVAKLCASFGTRAGYGAYRERLARDPESADLAKKLCKKDPEAARGTLCAQAAKETSGDETPEDVLRFLADSCPDEVRAFAKKECAGREFSGIPKKMVKLCVTYARDEMKQGQPAGGGTPEPAKTPQDQTKDKAKDKAKRLFKGLF